MRKPKKSVPVFMYHSVGIVNPKWERSHLTCPYETFEKQLLFLHKNSYSTIHLNELYNHVIGKQTIDKKSVVLTFDDGYLDNYVFAYPLLKQYGFKGTIFVTPDFVDPRPTKRIRIDQTNSVSKLETLGFLSWDEMQEMEQKGVMDIQSHAMTHTWYPASNDIIDFRHPGDDYKWMTWNSFPPKKPFLQTDDENLIEYGAPVYKFEKSLMIKRFFPDKYLDDHLVAFVKNAGGKRFFNNSNWRTILFNQADLFISKNELHESFESEQEWLSRIRRELKDSKSILENNLKKNVDFLCWPGGSGTSQGVAIAKEAGYKMTTAARDIPGSDRKNIKNNGLFYPDRIARTSPIMYKKAQKGQLMPVYCDGIGMMLRIASFNKKGLIQKLLKGCLYFYGLITYFLKR